MPDKKLFSKLDITFDDPAIHAQRVGLALQVAHNPVFGEVLRMLKLDAVEKARECAMKCDDKGCAASMVAFGALMEIEDAFDGLASQSDQKTNSPRNENFEGA